MKVESIEAFPIKIKVEEDLKGGTFSYSSYQTVLVKAVCDGVEGWGEAMTRFDPEASALVVKFLGKIISGQEFPDVGTAWRRIWKDLRVRGHTRGIAVEALSGIDIALHDCKGKLLRKPLNQFFSENPANEVPVFAGSLFASRGPMERQVTKAQEMGLLGGKVKVGFGVDNDRETLALVRKAWPEGMLVADANGAYDSTTAKKACEAFSDLDLSWFEEPVPSDDWLGYASLKGSKVSIGAGESWFVSDFDDPIEDRLVEVLEPSVSRCGGLGVEMDVARRAADQGIMFSPMTGMNSIISLAASVHVASAHPTIGVEYNPFANPLQSDLASGFEEPKDGGLRVPSGFGLGIEINKRFVKSHTK